MVPAFAFTRLSLWRRRDATAGKSDKVIASIECIKSLYDFIALSLHKNGRKGRNVLAVETYEVLKTSQVFQGLQYRICQHHCHKTRRIALPKFGLRVPAQG